MTKLEYRVKWHNTKKTGLGSVKTRNFLGFLCILTLYLLSKWLNELGDFKAIRPPPYRDSRKRNLTILLWHWPFGKSYSLEGNVCWDRYRIPHCRLVDQRQLLPSADVVVFHNRELMLGREKLPLDRPRPQRQRWAWLSLEAAENNGNLRKYANIFNMTITYRRDADITIPYGELVQREGKEDLVEDITVNKRSTVCWVVSNYNTRHKRSQVYRDLNHIVPVEIYGRWAKKTLPPGDLLPTISHCYFYLAFENTISKDYITEKLWKNAYQGGAVPVTLGPPLSDYKAVAPQNSFIHVDGFESPKELGMHLKNLTEDKKRYSEYFAWKRQWTVKLYTDWRERLCKVCTKYKTLPKHKVYSDLHAWANP